MQFNHQAWVRSGAIISFFYSFLLNKSTRAQSCNFLVKENAKGHYRPRGRTKFYRARRAVFHIPLDTAKHPDRKRHGPHGLPLCFPFFSDSTMSGTRMCSCRLLLFLLDQSCFASRGALCTSTPVCSAKSPPLQGRQL